MQQWSYAGHKTARGPASGSLQNPCACVEVDGAECVKIGLLNDRFFLVDKADFPLVMNYDEALLVEGSAFNPQYENLVPTWSAKPNGTIYCSNWPQFSSKEFAKKTVTLTNLLAGCRGQKISVKFVNGNAHDLRRCNLRFTAHTSTAAQPSKTYLGQPLIKPQISKSLVAKAIAAKNEWTPFPDLHSGYVRELMDYEIIQEFPGRWHPDINPYMLVQHGDKRFYRMRALKGQEFFFSELHLENVQRVPCLLGGKMAWVDHPVWYVGYSTKDLKTKGRKVGQILCTPVGCNPLALPRWVSGEGPLDGQRLPSLLVQHANNNAWDNRLENIKTFMN
jgi:hypothetical protein